MGVQHWQRLLARPSCWWPHRRSDGNTTAYKAIIKSTARTAGIRSSTVFFSLKLTAVSFWSNVDSQTWLFNAGGLSHNAFIHIASSRPKLRSVGVAIRTYIRKAHAHWCTITHIRRLYSGPNVIRLNPHPKINKNKSWRYARSRMKEEASIRDSVGMGMCGLTPENPLMVPVWWHLAALYVVNQSGLTSARQSFRCQMMHLCQAIKMHSHTRAQHQRFNDECVRFDVTIITDRRLAIQTQPVNELLTHSSWLSWYVARNFHRIFTRFCFCKF